MSEQTIPFRSPGVTGREIDLTGPTPACGYISTI